MTKYQISKLIKVKFEAVFLSFSAVCGGFVAAILCQFEKKL